jgi:hypothetical protein
VPSVARASAPLPKSLVVGDTVIKCPSPRNVLKYTCDHRFIAAS